MTFLKYLVFWSRSYHKWYKRKEIIIPTKYVIDQQDIEILKNIVFLRHKNGKIFGLLAPLARNNLWNFSHCFLVFWSRPYHEYYEQKDIIVPTIYVTDQQYIKILKK